MKQFFKKIIVTIITLEARVVLWKYKPKIITVTGNVGKTTTKDAIYAAFSTTHHVRRSEKSFNSEIGIPLTILGCENAWHNPFRWIENILKGLFVIVIQIRYPEWLILEIGADRPGNIKNITSWVRQDVSVITRFAKVPVHVEYFSSREELIAEKAYAVKRCKPRGVVVLNADDADSLAMKSITSCHVVTYSLNGAADIVGSHEQIYYEKDDRGIEVPAGMTFKVDFQGKSVPVVRKAVLGLQHVYPTLAAMAVAVSQKINIVSASEALSHDTTPPGRMKLLGGNKRTSIIDDTYNSSPVAVHEALETLRLIKTKGRKIAVLGDMLELGKHSIEEHKHIGKLVAGITDILVTVGIRARYIAEGALNFEMDEAKIFQFDESREAGRFLDPLIKEGDIILVKGSQSIRMERVVEEIMAEPLKKEVLLVRQDAEWQKKA